MMYKKWKLIGLLLLVAIFVLPTREYVCFAEDAETIGDAFKNGKVKGTIGSYCEFTKADADESDYGWGTSYFTLKYETQKWNCLSLGARFFVHGRLYSEHDNSTRDPFESDVETQNTLPELYLNYSFAEKSRITVGRWNHKKISHIDDAQSEGAYVTIKEISDWEFIVGVMTRFAEIDYDDGEDFGRTNNSQDLDSENKYGSDSKPYLFFIESKCKPLDMIKCNPYIMSQNGYATVYGLDTKIEKKVEDFELTYGGKVNYYHVSTDILSKRDSNNFAVFPYISKGPIEVTIGYAKFDNDDSFNKPAWLRDYFSILDQQKEYGKAGSEEYFAKLKLTIDKFWMHVAYGDNNYDFTSSKGDNVQEYELQFGYKFAKNLDINIRLFDVRYDNVDERDYQKGESRLRFKF